MALKEILVPDIGDYTDVDVIEVTVSIGDVIAEEDSLITLETDKASMEVPAPFAGKVVELNVTVGDKVSQGSLILKVETDKTTKPTDAKSTPQTISVEETPASQLIEIKVPDIGDYTDVDVIEISVAAGDTIAEEDSLITLETDKASMEVPAPFAGKIVELKVAAGDKVSEGSTILTLSTSSQIAEETPVAKTPKQKEINLTEDQDTKAIPHANITSSSVSAKNASPAVRRLARILGVDLTKVAATGPKGRITKDDCNQYIKNALAKSKSGLMTSGGLDLLADPKIDFSKFGEIEIQPLTRINKLSLKNLHRNWVKIPHVTFYDDADITDLEEFRKAKKAFAEKSGVKLTPVVFLVKAAAKVLQEFPKFNSSLSEDGEALILKKYINIGVAVDTPNGLLVPVIKDVDKKTIFDISREFMDLVNKGRQGKIKPTEIQGACFTISSLGVLGTTGFTPIINMPEVAIMGVSKSVIKPVYNGKEFVPRVMLPLSLSADHRVIDGAMAAQFLTR